MTDLTVVPNHVPFWKSTISPVYSVVVGIMLFPLPGCGPGGKEGGGAAFSTAVTPMGNLGTLGVGSGPGSHSHRILRVLWNAVSWTTRPVLVPGCPVRQRTSYDH